MASKDSRARALVGQCAEPLGEGREGLMGEREPRGGLFRGKRWQGVRGGVRFGGGDDGERGGQRVRSRPDVEWESDRRGMKRVRERRAATSFEGLAIKEGERETVASLAFPRISTSGACQQAVSTSQQHEKERGPISVRADKGQGKKGQGCENKGRWNKGQSRDKAVSPGLGFLYGVPRGSLEFQARSGSGRRPTLRPFCFFNRFIISQRMSDWGASIYRLECRLQPDLRC